MSRLIVKRFISQMASPTSKPGLRRFAPLRSPPSDLKLDGELPPDSIWGAPKLQGVVFDVDGTLCKPQTYMFAEMRTALSIPKTVDILTHIYSLPTPSAQAQAMASVRAIESRAMTLQTPQPGLTSLMTYLDSRSVRKGICTRNFDAPVSHLLTKFLPDSVFHPIVTRDFRPPKPDPAGILHIARSWGLTRRVESGGERDGLPVKRGEVELVETREGEEVADASGLIMVGDSIDDMTAGRRAGAATVLLVNEVNRRLVDHEHTDVVISSLHQLIGILEVGFPGRVDKETN